MEAYIQLLDKIIALLNRKERQRVRLFGEVVDPLFRETKDVAINQSEVLHYALELVERPSGLSEGVKLLRERRNEYVLARIKVRAMARCLSENYPDATIGDFGKSILRFFEATHGCILEGVCSKTMSIVDLFSYLTDGRTDARSHDEKAVITSQIARLEVPAEVAKLTTSSLHKVGNFPSEHISRDNLQAIIESTIADQEFHWKDIAYKYSQLQLALLD